MKLSLAPIVAQLKAAKLSRVEGVLEFAGLTAAPAALPAFFVVPLSDTASANPQDAGARDQAVDAGFAVMICLDGARRHGAGVSDELSTEIGRVIDALAGWTHPQAARACDFAGGQLASASGSVVVWQVRFRTRWRLRKAS